MGLAGTTHLISAVYTVKGWSLYKSTVNKSGKITSQVYKKQVVEGNKVANMTKTITGNTQKMSTTFTKATGKTNDLMKALKRAAIVAPVWLALRAVMMKTIRTIADGNKAWGEWDRALIKSKAVIHTTTMSISNAYVRLQDEVEALSLKTGISLDKITNAFFRFGTLGTGFEESLAGMTASVNIALALGGNLEQVVRPLAFAYDLLGETMDATKTPMENMTELGSKMFAIWKINAFEIDGFSQALLNFLPTANAMNFTLDETTSLLAAMSSSAILAGRGGRLLRQSVLRLTANLGKLGSELGLAVNPELESSNEILLKVLGRIKELGESASVQKASKALTAIFGGARMGEAARGLISVYDLLEQNIDITTASGEVLDKQMKDYADRLKEVEDSLGRQMDISKNLDTQLGRVFLKGTFGGKEYAETLKLINKAKTGLLPVIENLAKATRDYFLDGKTGAHSYLEALLRIKKEQQEMKELQAFKLLEEDIDFYKSRPSTGRYTTPEPSKPYEEEAIVKSLTYENQIKLNLLKEGLEIVKLEAKGVSKSQIAYKKLTGEVRERVNQYNDLKDLENLGFKKLEEKQILLLLEQGEHEKILALTKEQIFTQDKTTELAKLTLDVEKEHTKEQAKKTLLLIKHATDLLKLEGATKSQIIEQTMAMNRQADIGQSELSLLKNKLALEAAINEEKIKQNKYSSESVKLYEIYQKYGARMATATQEFLGGKEFDFRSHFGKQLEKILQESFGGRLTQSKIPDWLPTTSMRLKEDTIPEISMQKLQLPAITTKVDKIVINVKQALSEALEEKGTSQSILDQLAEAIKTNPKIKEAIDERIENY